MNLKFSSDEDNPVVNHFIQNQVETSHPLNRNIHASDEMFAFLLDVCHDRDAALFRYFRCGLSVFRTVEQVINWKFQGFANVSSFLEFACGYGRCTRYLIQQIPSEKFWVSDIYPNAVEFQVEQFKVNSIISTNQPENYPITQKYDCILVVSLFSHLPKRTGATST